MVQNYAEHLITSITKFITKVIYCLRTGCLLSFIITVILNFVKFCSIISEMGIHVVLFKLWLGGALICDVIKHIFENDKNVTKTVKVNKDSHFILIES